MFSTLDVILIIAFLVQGMWQSRSRSQVEVDLCVGNEALNATLAIGYYYLTLPSGIVMELLDFIYKGLLSFILT